MRKGFILLDGVRTAVTIDASGQVSAKQGIIDTPQWLPVSEKSVYGVALNYKDSLETHQAEFKAAPYQSPPKSPVLFIKTPNTYNAHKGHIVFPKGVDCIQAGPALAVVIGKDASRVKAKDAWDYIEGLTLANEVSLPEISYYRPAIKEKCRDSFCPIGPWIVSVSDVVNPEDLAIRLTINGELRQQVATRDLVRNIPALLEAITEFMTLREGDVLITGTSDQRIDINVGDCVEVTIEGIGTLANTVVAE